MVKYLAVKTNDYKLIWPAENYFFDADRMFNIKCDITKRNNNIFTSKYIIKLEGDAENIESYISYLIANGMKIGGQ